MTRAVIYCRVSTKEQAQNLSLPTQLAACQSYCARERHEVVSVFTDAGESAKTTDRREFQRLLEFCRNKASRVNFLVVYNVTRFARNAHDHVIIRAQLQALGVSLRSVNEPIGDDATGKLTENVLAAFAQFDNDQKAERTKAGMRAALERGRWTWQAPVGFRNGNVKAGEPSLVLDPDRAPLVRHAFEMMATGMVTATDALRRVTALGLVTRKGRRLTAQTFGALLRNPIYAGQLNAPGFKLKNAPGDFEPLISESVFHQVKAVLEGRTRFKPHALDRPDFPLRRFVVCDRCEAPLTGSSPKGRSKKYSYYHCRNCRGVSIRKEALETNFMELLESLRPQAAVLPLFRAIVLDRWQDRVREVDSLLAQRERTMNELVHREGVLEEAFLFHNRVDKATYDRQLGHIRRRIAEVASDVDGADVNRVDVEGLFDFAETILLNAADLWTQSQPEQRLRLQRSLFPQGLRFRGGGFGTAVTCLAFMQLQPHEMSNSGLASPNAVNPFICVGIVYKHAA